MSPEERYREISNKVCIVFERRTNTIPYIVSTLQHSQCSVNLSPHEQRIYVRERLRCHFFQFIAIKGKSFMCDRYIHRNREDIGHFRLNISVYRGV